LEGTYKPGDLAAVAGDLLFSSDIPDLLNDNYPLLLFLFSDSFFFASSSFLFLSSANFFLAPATFVSTFGFALSLMS